MNEDQVEKVLTGYRDSLGTSSRTPTPRPGRMGLRIAVAVAALAAVAAFVMWPKDAVASALEQMNSALSDVTTMEMRYMSVSSTGEQFVFSTQHYKDGKWRGFNRQGMALECLSVVRDGRVLEEFTRLPYATLDVWDPGYYYFVKDGDSALDFVLRQIDQGRIDDERVITIQPHAPVNGRPTYVVHLVREIDGYIADVVVDTETDLPLWATSEFGLGVTKTRFRAEYAFDLPLDDKLFELVSDKPTIRIPEAKAELAEDWKGSLGEVDGTKIRHASVTPDGTIWIAVTSPQSGRAVLPSALQAAGSDYARLPWELVPSAILGKRNDFSVDGDPAMIVGFAPLSSGTLPKTATISFALRESRHPGVGGLQTSGRPLEKQVVVELVRERGKRPSYFAALDLSHFQFQLDMIKNRATADELEKRGDLGAAARAFERLAESQRSFWRYGRPETFLQSAELYERAGMPGDAARVRAIGEQVRKLLIDSGWEAD